MEQRVLLSPQQKRLVQLTLAKVLLRSGTFSDVLFGQLFRADPSLMAVFKTSKAELGRRLLHLLEIAVSLVDAPDELAQAMHNLGQHHAEYRAIQEHYPLFGRVFAATLERVLGRAYNPEIAAAWTELFDLLAALATEELYDRV